MTAIEATSGTYRSRVDGTLVLSVEIDPRFRNDALKLFGMPGTPMALAALLPDHLAQKQSEPVKAKSGPLLVLACQFCKEPNFYAWVRPVYDRRMDGDGSGFGDVTPDELGGIEAYCRHCILAMCFVESRKDLDHDSAAAEVFHREIRIPFMEWVKNRGVR